MNYLIKGIAVLLTTSFIYRVIALLLKLKLIDSFSAISSGVLLGLIGFSVYFIWHSNPSMNTNIINFIGFVGLFGALLGIII